jgi:hypothetical protein
LVVGVRCIYLYIVFPHLLGGFPAYLHTCTCTIYMWPLAPMEYN